MTDDLGEPGGIQLAQASGDARAKEEVVAVTQPPSGGEVVLPSPAGRVYDLQFDPRIAQVRVIDGDGDGDLDVVLLFDAGTPDESRIVFTDMVEATQSGAAPFLMVGDQRFGAESVVRQAQALASEQPTLEAAAPTGPEAEGTGVTQYNDDLGSVIDLLNAQGVITGVAMSFPLIDPEAGEEDREDDGLAAVAGDGGIVDGGDDGDDEGEGGDGGDGGDDDVDILLGPAAFGFSVISVEGDLIGIPGSDVTRGGFVYQFDVGEENDISDNIHGTDPEDGVTTDFTINALPDFGVVVVDRDSDGTLDEVYGLSDDFIPGAAPLPPGGLHIDSDDTVFSFLPIEEVLAEPLNGSLPDADGFAYFTTDSDGLSSDDASVGLTFARPTVVVGSNADDRPGQDEPHTVPNPDEDASGPILGGNVEDLLIGDPGGAQISGQFNVAIAVDVTGSIGPDNIATMNAAVDGLAQQIIDRGIAERTVLNLITFAVRGNQDERGLASSETFTWDGNQFVSEDGRSLSDVVDSEVTDPRGSTDFEPALQEAADFFNALNDGAGPSNDDINRVFFMTDGQDNIPRNSTFNPDDVPDIYGPDGLIAQDDLQVRVFGLQSFGGDNSGFDPDQLNLLDDGLPPQPGEALRVGAEPPVDQVEADIAVIGFDEVESALSEDLLATLFDDAGSDVIFGRDGNDVIFGDVPNTDSLALAEGLDLPDGSGFFTFLALEAGDGALSPDWDRVDTIAYLIDPANRAELIGVGRGQGDTIDAGGGDDIVFAQGGDDSVTGGSGADTFVYTLGADEGTDSILDFSVAEGDLLSFVNVSDSDASGTLGIADVVDGFVDGGGAGSVDTLSLLSGTTIMIADVDGLLTNLSDIEANSAITSAMA